MPKEDRSIVALGHKWGDDVDMLLTLRPSTSKGYDIILSAEPLWKDTYTVQDNLLLSITRCLGEKGAAFVAFAHRPTPPRCDNTSGSSDGVHHSTGDEHEHADHTADHDMEFFEKARRVHGLRVDLLEVNRSYADPGEIDKIDVYLYQLTKS